MLDIGMDSAEVSTLIKDQQQGAAFRKQTKDYIRECLTPGSKPKAPANIVIASFGIVGTALRDSYTNCKLST
jgi:hypothetical protein